MGGKSSGGGGDQQVQTEAVPWSGAQPHLQNIMSSAGSLYSQGGPGYYPGQTFAGRDPLSDQAQNLRLNYATNSMPGQIYDAQRAQSFALNSPDAANNPYVQNMMQSNQYMANRNLSENLLPQIAGGAVASGQMGGSRQGIAEGLAMRGTQEALANANAGMMLDAYGKGLGAQSNALQMAPQTMGMGLQPMDIMSGVGAYNTGIDTQALDSDMQRWNYNQNLPWDTLGKYSSIVSGNNQWGQNQTSEGGGSSPLAGALGGAATGLGAASYLSGAGSGLFGGTPTLAGLGGPGTMALYGLGGALLGGLL